MEQNTSLEESLTPKKPSKKPSGAQVRKGKRLAAMVSNLNLDEKNSSPHTPRVIFSASKDQQLSPNSTRETPFPPPINKKRLNPSPDEATSNKRQRQLTASTFSNVLKGTPLAIIPRGYPTCKFDDKMTKQVERVIFRAVGCVHASEAGIEPVFHGLRLMAGLIQIIADDLSTIEWFKRIIPIYFPDAYVEDWDSAPKPHKVGAWLKGENFSSSYIKHLLVVQNRNLDIDEWEVISNKPNNHGRYVVLALMPSSLLLLEAQDFRVNYGVSQVRFHKLDEKLGGRRQTKSHKH